MIHRILAASSLVLAFAHGAAAQPAVFVVRHAERADAGMAAAKVAGADPDLSALGRDRADSLATVLKDAQIAAIFVTEYRRTQQTAAPLARRAGITPTRLTSKDIPGLVEKIKGATGNVLVVGHSNSVPELIKALGISAVPTIEEEDFDNLFVVVRGPKPMLLRLHYR
jgi:broad specificity phosphatase PhoE